MPRLLGHVAVGDDVAGLQGAEHAAHVVVEAHLVMMSARVGSADAMSDAPDADFQEQHQEVRRGEHIDSPDTDPDVPEADAIEQAIEVEEDEER